MYDIIRNIQSIFHNQRCLRLYSVDGKMIKWQIMAVAKMRGKHKTSRQRVQDTSGTDVYSVTATPPCLIMISVLRAHLRIKLHSYRHDRNFACVIESWYLPRSLTKKQTTTGPKTALTSSPPHTFEYKPCCYYYWLYEIKMYGVRLSLTATMFMWRSVKKKEKLVLNLKLEI